MSVVVKRWLSSCKLFILNLCFWGDAFLTDTNSFGCLSEDDDTELHLILNSNSEFQI
jgi:hypothetical protein